MFTQRDCHLVAVAVFTGCLNEYLKRELYIITLQRRKQDAYYYY